VTKRRIAGLIVGVAGLVCAMACARSEAPVQRPEGFVEVLDTIERSCADTTNTYECAKAVEQYRLGKGVRGVTRVGKRLSIAVRNGLIIDLTDTPDPGADDYVGYTYTEYLACFGYHLIHRQLQDGEAYLLVQAETGARIDVLGVPILADDCGRMAIASGLPHANSVLQIWRWNEGGRATLEWGYQPDSPWTPGTVVWKNTTQLSLPYVTEDDPGTRRTFTARLYSDGWRVEP
jgi:hypothetical protein